MQQEIGILTLHRSNNYGAVLQTYALSKFLTSLGYKPFILNYKMEKTSVIDYLKNPIAFVLKVGGKNALTFGFLKSKLQGKKSKSEEESFAPIFEQFRNEYLNITAREYDYETLKDQAPSADAYIVGSDQVWAADFVFSSPAFLLGFVPSNTKKISYAASFGKARLERYLRKDFKLYAPKFDALSVREASGVDIVRKVTGLEAEQVVDPTLLIDDYSQIIDYSLVPDGEYMFSYRLGQSEDLCRWTSGALVALSSKLNLPHYVVSTNTADASLLVGDHLRPTPGQLLGLIDRASLVVTNSFHGTVFSILLSSKFLTFSRDSASDKQNLRMTELLSILGMLDRYCAPFEHVDQVLEKMRHSCDYDTAQEELQKLQRKSIRFLRTALE